MTAIAPSPARPTDPQYHPQGLKAQGEHGGNEAVVALRPGAAPHPTLQLVHPAPLFERRAATQRASRSTFGLSLVFSVLAHVLAGALAWWLSAAPAPTTLTAEARDIFEISVIPLSALDTVLPLGSTAPTTTQVAPPPEVTNPSPPKQPAQPQPQKKIAPVFQRKAPERKPSPPESAVTAPQTTDPSAQSITTQGTTTQSSTTEATTATQNSGSKLGVPTGESGVTESARINYQEAVASLLARAKRYPERALRRGLTGEGAIRIEIRADGELSRFEIVRSTELPLLDEELRAMVDRATPFPAFPADLRRASITLIVPVTFTITAGRG